jgi:DNA-binding LytR/AlgR family response regulator
MRTLLVDDEPLALRRLSMALADIPSVEVVGTASDADEAMRKIESLHPELVILDVEMPGRSGMALAADLPEEHRPEIVFVTAFEHYAPDAFTVEAADYLLKPVRLDRLRQAMERAARRRALRELAKAGHPVPETAGETEASAGSAPDSDLGGIWIPEKGGSVRVSLDRIIWIEAARDYVLIHTPNRAHMLRVTMGELEERLDPALIPRVHRSAFVRLGAVKHVRRPARGLMTLVLEGGAEVQVGPSYVRPISERLH